MNYKKKYDDTFKSVSIDNYEDFKNEFQKQWDNLKSRSFSVDQSCQTHDFFDLRRDEILGRFSIRYDDILYDCLMNPRLQKMKRKVFS